MSTVEININTLTANFSATCNFKIKIVISTSPYKESAENKHSFKYAKGSSQVNIYEKLVLKPFAPLTSESKLQFFLEVYTKKGYKTAGIGVFHLSKGAEINVPIKIDIQKCPLGKGNLEFQFLNFNLKPSESPKRINIPPIGGQVSYDKVSNYSNINDISNISYITNLTNIEPITNITNIHTHENSPNNIHNSKRSITPININNSKNNHFHNNNNNDEIIKNKDRQIKELKNKFEYYEEENKELKNLINDFKKEIKTLKEEKNMLLKQEKEKYQKIIDEKEDLKMENISLKENINILKNNKNDSEQKCINIKNQSDKQIKNLIQQVKSLNNKKAQLENENKLNEEKFIALDRKYKEMSINYQKKISELKNNYSSEKNNDYLNYNEKLKSKEEEIAKLNVKIKIMEENIQSLNDLIELNDKQKGEKEELTENMTKLLDQISSKDKEIFDLKKEVSELNNKISKEYNDRKTQNMLNGITEKELKSNINELQNIINEKDNELVELRTKYDNIKYNSKKLKPKIHFIEDSDEEPDNGYSKVLMDQIKEIQKTYKEREEKLLNEKNEEIKKLRMRNKDLVRESHIDKNNIDVKKYLNEINRLKTEIKNLEDDIVYYKDMNNKYMDNEKRIIIIEEENIKLQQLLDVKNDEIISMNRKQIKLEEEKKALENQLVNSKGKLGEVLNELVEAETKCVHLEEEQRQMRKTILNGGK